MAALVVASTTKMTIWSYMRCKYVIKDYARAYYRESPPPNTFRSHRRCVEYLASVWGVEPIVFFNTVNPVDFAKKFLSYGAQSYLRNLVIAGEIKIDRKNYEPLPGDRETIRVIRLMYEEKTDQSAEPGRGPADYILQYAGLPVRR